MPQSYFVEGCDTPPQTAFAPSLRDRERTNLVEVVRGWNLRKRTRTHQPAYAPQNCGEQNVAAPGCCAPGGCTQTFPPRDAARKLDAYANPKNFGPRSGNLADPLSENDWEKNATHRDQPEFAPDELMEPPSNIEQKSNGKPQSNPQLVPRVPDASEIGPTPALPIPLPADQAKPLPAPSEQQINPNSVNSNVKPPLWPRLGQPAPKPANLPVAAPALQEDSTLPMIQPGRRI